MTVYGQYANTHCTKFMLKDIYNINTGEYLCDHIWVDWCYFSDMLLNDTAIVKGSVVQYTRVDGSIDYNVAPLGKVYVVHKKTVKLLEAMRGEDLKTGVEKLGYGTEVVVYGQYMGVHSNGMGMIKLDSVCNVDNCNRLCEQVWLAETSVSSTLLHCDIVVVKGTLERPLTQGGKDYLIYPTDTKLIRPFVFKDKVVYCDVMSQVVEGYHKEGKGWSKKLYNGYSGRYIHHLSEEYKVIKEADCYYDIQYAQESGSMRLYKNLPTILKHVKKGFEDCIEESGFVMLNTDDNTDVFDIMEEEQSTDTLNDTSVTDSEFELEGMLDEVDELEGMLDEVDELEGKPGGTEDTAECLVVDFGETEDTTEGVEDTSVDIGFGFEDTEEEHEYTEDFEGTEDTEEDKSFLCEWDDEVDADKSIGYDEDFDEYVDEDVAEDLSNICEDSEDVDEDFKGFKDEDDWDWDSNDAVDEDEEGYGFQDSDFEENTDDGGRDTMSSNDGWGTDFDSSGTSKVESYDDWDDGFGTDSGKSYSDCGTDFDSSSTDFGSSSADFDSSGTSKVESYDWDDLGTDSGSSSINKGESSDSECEDIFGSSEFDNPFGMVEPEIVCGREDAFDIFRVAFKLNGFNLLKAMGTLKGDAEFTYPLCEYLDMCKEHDVRTLLFNCNSDVCRGAFSSSHDLASAIVRGHLSGYECDFELQAVIDGYKVVYKHDNRWC